MKKINNILEDYWISNLQVIQAKDGSIYLSTSNMDGRGERHMGEDKILRLILK